MKTITATPNKTKLTFTIRKFENGKVYSKYRTMPMSKEEFDDNTFNTLNDWQQFLNNNQVIIIK